MGKSRACRASLNFVAQRVFEGAYVGDSIWRDVEEEAARTVWTVQAVQAVQAGVVGLLARPTKTAAHQLVAWGQCAPPRRVAHYEAVVGNQNTPFWIAHIACRLAVFRRILSSAVCRALSDVSAGAKTTSESMFARTRISAVQLERILDGG